MRVLVVDDEPQILRALRINLHARQFDVITAADGTTALEAAKNQRPDLLILDLGLPDTDGVDVIRSLRSWTDVPDHRALRAEPAAATRSSPSTPAPTTTSPSPSTSRSSSPA